VRKDFKTLEEMAANLVSAGSQAPEITGTVGRLISVIIIMIFGVTLFFNLARALLTPSKVLVSLPDLRPAAPR
jgi:type IV secretory pathway VirB2 component (pilin)